MAPLRAVWRTTALIGAVCVGAGAAVGLALTAAPTADNLALPPGPSTVDVVERDFVDQRVVKVTPEVEQPWGATSDASGTVRHYDCREGESLESGSTVLVVDDRPVMALHLSSPPWRDLAPGAHGDDVLDLQAELARLGYDVTQDGRYGRQVEAAVEDLWHRAGATGDVRSVDRDRIVWIPETLVNPASCPLRLGERLAPGTVVLTSGGGLTALAVQLPDNTAPGERDVAVGGVSSLLSADLVTRDPALLAAFVSAHPDVAAGAGTGSATSLTLTSELATPVPVVAVPPSALYDISGVSACLLAPTAPVAVQIVASQLGEVMVTAPQLPTSVASRPSDGQPCR